MYDLHVNGAEDPFNAQPPLLPSVSTIPEESDFLYACFLHDVTKIQTKKLLLLLSFYFHV